MHSRRLASLLALLLPLLATAALAAPVATAEEAFLRIDLAAQAGDLDADRALLLKFQLVFDPEQVPEALRPEPGTMIRCATPLMVEYEQRRDTLDEGLRTTIDGYLSPEKEISTLYKAGTYISPSGTFRMTYEISGGQAVPLEDIDPANGIPDFVERCAIYCDESWDREVTELGFTAPVLSTGYYEISFENMSAYGYTTVTGGTTRIVLHNDFEGFPPNEDPEGNAIGAAKVTVAHEFKHATQYATSSWSEGGWVEVDATWAEDVVYDVVNDYYNYLPGGSSISDPETSLDSGGSGSYDDCIWQHWMSETWGEPMIVELWDWRATHSGETMLTSYDTILQNYGSGLVVGFPVFAAWNYATGTRAIVGLGYGEAASYPTAPLSGTISAYPGGWSGSVNQLAANLVRATGLSGDPGALHVDFTRDAGSSLGVVAVILKTDGTGVLESVPLVGDAAAYDLSVPLDQIAEVGFAVGNGALGTAKGYSLTLSENIDLPVPALTPGAASIAASVEAGSSVLEQMTLSNTGEAGSTLNYQVLVVQSWPAKIAPQRSVAGSTMEASPSDYLPGTTASVDFIVTNGSTDDEWLTDITLDFPAGVVVNSSTDFVGGTDGPLVTDNATGDGVTVTWSDPGGTWGNIYGGQSAVASVNLSFDAALSGDLNVDFTIGGDIYGAEPHSISGTVVLSQSGPSLKLESPVGGELWATGGTPTIQWSTSGTLADVKVELSRDGGTAWETLAASIPNTGSYGWTVTGPASALCRVRVSSLDDSVSDSSPASFTIYEPVSWCMASPVAGSIEQGFSQILDLDFDATLLAAGNYAAMLVILHDGPGSPTLIPLDLEVTPSGVSTPPEALAFHLGPNAPNPFNPSTTIRYQIPSPGRVQLRVYDLTGRLVSTLVDRELEAGPHQALWQGQDETGRRVASGVYLYRLTAAGHEESRSMVLLK